MEIRDVVHGVIQVEPHELPIIDSYPFQRLRQIKQMGFAEHSYPGASHNRFIHSIGAMNTASLVFESIFKGRLEKTNANDFLRFRAIVRCAALLHDIGHGPLSHTTEFAMPNMAELKIPHVKKQHRKASHEDYTLKIILDSELTPILEKAGSVFGFKPLHIATLIEPSLNMGESFFNAQIRGKTVNFKPILHQMISSELDADRMDYLRRDSIHSGVSYGLFDADWIIANLTYFFKDGKCFLALKHRGLYAFEDFLLSRFHMFLMVYLHHKTVIYDEMLGKYLSDPECEYRLPSNISDYLKCTDAQLNEHLSHSKNEWAKRIIEKRPYKLLLETHSGIPSTETAKEQQSKLFKRTLEDLRNKKVPNLASKSTGELSKYFLKTAEDPIYVRYDNLYTAPQFIPLFKCTSLFTQYPANREISRIFVAPEHFDRVRSKARQETLFTLD